MRFRLTHLLSLTAVLGLALSASADTIDFGSPTNRTLTPTTNPQIFTYDSAGTPSSSANFNFGGFTVTVYGYALAGGATGLTGPNTATCPAGPSNCSADLALNERGPNEVGVGIWGDAQGDAEISNNDYIAIDLSSLLSGGTLAANAPGSLFLQLQSLQTGESGTISQGGNVAVLGTSSKQTFVGPPETQSFSINLAGLNSSNDVVFITGGNVDVLVSSNAPEPAGIFFFGTGLVGLASFLRRKLIA